MPIQTQSGRAIGSQWVMPTAVITTAPVTPVQKKEVAELSRRAT